MDWTPDALRVWRATNGITEYQRGEDAVDPQPQQATREALIAASSQPAGEGVHIVLPFLRTDGTHPELRREGTAASSSLSKLAALVIDEPAGAAFLEMT